MTGTGRIAQVSVSAGGVPKRAVESARVTTLGVDSDQHRHPRYHGGPDRAICLFSLERIRDLQAEGHAIQPGSLGENVTVEGLDWSAVEPGRHVQLGASVLIEVTRYTSPCVNITASFRDGDVQRISLKRHPGWSRVYARVLREGTIRPGDPVALDGAAADPREPSG